MAPMDRAERRSLSYLLATLGLLVMVGAGAGLVWAFAPSGLYASYYAPYALFKAPAPLKAQGPLRGETEPGLIYGQSGRKGPQTAVTSMQRILAGGRNVEHTWGGFFQAPTDGPYTFRVASRQPASVYIDGVEVLGMSAKGRLGDASNVIPLEAGPHGFRLVLRPSKKTDRQSLDFEWTGPRGYKGSLDGVHFRAPADAEAKRILERMNREEALPREPGEIGAPPFWGEPMSRVAVPTMRLLTQPYRLKWPYGSYKFPTHLYEATAYIRGTVRIEAGEGARLALLAKGWAQVWLGEDALFPNPLNRIRTQRGEEIAPGTYPFTLAYRGDGNGSLQFGTQEGKDVIPFDGDRFQLLSEDADALRAARGPPLFALLALGLGLFAFGALRLMGSDPSLFELGHALWARRIPLGVLCLVALAAGMRLYDYTIIPAWGETMDEYANAWNGWHIWHGDGPRAWSPFSAAYDEIDRVLWMDNWFNVSQPYVDRPPLFALLLGGVLTLAGTPDYFSADLAVMRLLPIGLSLLSIPLIFGVSRRLYGESVAWIATALFVVSPLIIWTQRLAKSESLLALLWILGIWASLKGVEARTKAGAVGGWLWVALLCAGLSPWCKEVGIAAIPIIAWLWWREGLRKEGVAIFVAGGLIAALYPLYGVWIAGDVFWDVVSMQGHKKTAFDVGFNLLTVGKATFATLDGAGGIMLFLWFSAVATLREKERLPHTAAALYLVLLAPLVGSNAIYGWYRLPLYPFLVMTAALFLRDLWRRPNLLGGGIALVCVHWMTLQHVAPLGLEPSHGLLRTLAAAVIVGLLPAQLLGGHRSLRLGRFTLLLLAVSYVALSALILYHQLVAYRV